jgi:hypothetical protein
METEDLLIFPESDAPVYNYFTNEKELIETKQKVKELEDKLKVFESKMMKLETDNSGFSIFPMLDSETKSLRFYNMNAETIKILGNTLLIDEEEFSSDLMQFWNQKTAYEGISFEFLKQFKNVKQFIIDNGRCARKEILINICRTIIKNNNCEIVVKYNSINTPSFLFTQCFNSEIYRKITIEITNMLNLVGGQASYVSASFITENKIYCDKNNIEFKSNIGL